MKPEKITPARKQAPRRQTKSNSIPFALENFDRLPDSATVPLRIISAHRHESVSTTRRRIVDGTLPELEPTGPRAKRMNVGKYRQAMKQKEPA